MTDADNSVEIPSQRALIARAVENILWGEYNKAYGDDQPPQKLNAWTVCMSDFSMKTAEMHDWLNRFSDGDPQALDSLLKRASARLDRLARKMVKRFPRISRWAEPEDILQNATLRFIRALKEVRPSSMRDFYGLAATQIRRELLDMTRKLYGPEGLGQNQASISPDDSAVAQKLEPVANHGDEAELERWCDFHREVEQLPTDEREVVGLIFYHGCKQKDVANLLGIAVKTVQRRWATALEKLKAHLSDWPVAND